MDAAEWVATKLKSAGLENIEICPTGLHACVYADWLHAPSKPTVLIYGHFDVQPADPLELWDSPPFEPVVKDGCVFARGASDMKNNLLLSILAAESMLATVGKLPVNVKFLLEGQEEIGSRDLGAFISSNRERLACDIVLTPDGGQWSADTPAMFMGTKGLCAMQIDIETASMDLHSGMYGGAVPNALHAAAELVSSFQGKHGDILVEGFYDQVITLTEADRERIAKIPFEEQEYKEQIGIASLIGEDGFSTYERAWARPTLEINGLWGGYTGDGVKTVIPAKAHVKVTCRIVAGQEPDDVMDRLCEHIDRHTPVGANVSVTRFPGSAKAYRMPAENTAVQAVAAVLAERYGKPPYYVATGGTLPIMDMFLQELNSYTIDCGFSLDDEKIHSPNEFTRISNFERGAEVYGLIFEKLGEFGSGQFTPNG
jgi:acetylornithine deacetylase/succinyl-diaminopimelate desuccinylase-like protein